MVAGPLSMIRCCPSGDARIGALERQLQRADQAAKLAEPVVAEAEVFPVDDVDLVAPHDRRLIDRFKIILAEVGLKRDIDRLGQVLKGRLDADLARANLQRHVAQAAGLPGRHGAALARARRNRDTQRDLAGACRQRRSRRPDRRRARLGRRRLRNYRRRFRPRPR